MGNYDSNQGEYRNVSKITTQCYLTLLKHTIVLEQVKQNSKGGTVNKTLYKGVNGR